MRRITRGEAMAAYELPDRDRTWVRLNFVSSIDGAVTRGGVSGGLGTDDDRVVFCALRAMADVVLVAAGTVRAEGYSGSLVDDDAVAWRAERGLLTPPILAIVSGTLSLAPSHPVFTEAVARPVVITSGAADVARRQAMSAVAEVVVCGDDRVDLALARSELARQGLRQVLFEGGPALVAAMIEADLVDEVCLTVSPVFEGGGAGRMVRGGRLVSHRMRLMHAITSGDTVLLRYMRAGRRP